MQDNNRRPCRSPILLCILLACFMASCSKSYYAERDCYRVQKRYGHVLKYPERAGSGEFGDTVAGLRKALVGCPAWNRAGEIQFLIGALYAKRQEFGRARVELKKVLTNYARNQKLCSQALFLMGRCHEAENDWKSALACYSEISERYPLTELGLTVPLYVVRYYRDHGRPEESARAYEDALAGYRAIIESNPYSKNVPQLEDMIVHACGQYGDWERAARYLESVADKPVKGRSVYPVQLKLAGLYRNALRQPGKALELYRKVLAGRVPEAVRKSVFLELGRCSAELETLGKSTVAGKKAPGAQR